MPRHSNHSDWVPGEYIAGHIGYVDSDGHGRIGNTRTIVRTREQASEGDYFFGEIVEVNDDEIVAKRADQPTEEDMTVWVQQSQDTDSTMGWYPEYPLRAAPLLWHCNLFTEVQSPSSVATSKPSVSKDEPPRFWSALNSATEIAVALVFFIGGGAILVNVLGDTVLTDWGTALGQSPIMLLPLLLGIGITYAGISIFEKLIYLSGAIFGGGLGIAAGFVISNMFQLTGNIRLGVIGVMMSAGAGVMGGLFVIMHYIAILFSAFLSAAVPIFFLLSGGAPFSSSLSAWLMISALIAIIIGVAAAILVLFAYQMGLIVVTSFIGSVFLVYLPNIAQAAAQGSGINFPNIDFLIVLVSGIAVQILQLKS